MDDEKLALEEARRAAQHGAVKANVEGEVQAEISERAAQKTVPDESRRIDHVAGEFRSKAVDEVVDTEQEVQRARGLARVSQIVDYIFYVIYALLGMRFLLALLAARSNTGFVQFIVTVSNPFYAPFQRYCGQPAYRSGAYSAAANRCGDHCVRFVASRHQRVSANVRSSKDTDLIVQFV